MKISLHGAIPVYVLVDTESNEVTYVAASDEEFFYVGKRDEDAVSQPTRLEKIDANALPLAYQEDGTPFTDEGVIEKARRVAEGEIGEGTWPAWSWGF